MEVILKNTAFYSKRNTEFYKAYTLKNLDEIPQIRKLTKEQLFAIQVVAHVFPFKTNDFVIRELVDWDNIPDDPMFILNFPQKEMLLPHHFAQMADALLKNKSDNEIKQTANRIRMQLNPHPDGQREQNIPSVNGIKLPGMQHKYRETVLFFPQQGQTCHAYCTFCFRWPQFSGIAELKFASRQVELLLQYVRQHRAVTNILFTGGDPFVMRAKTLAFYIEPLLDKGLENIQTIRIGTKALSYFPYRFLYDNDADDLMRLFEKIVKAGKNLAIMAHINHPAELMPVAVQKAIARVQSTGAQIRTQSPLLRHINDSAKIWAKMWRKQVNLGCIPYYMFIARDTGAQHYFGIPLVEAWQIFRQAYQKVSGIGRTVRGPVMSCTPGKVQILGVGEINGQKVLTLRMIQGRDPEWIGKPFFAEYDEKAKWINELKPSFGKNNFFFEKDSVDHKKLNLNKAETINA